MTEQRTGPDTDRIPVQTSLDGGAVKSSGVLSGDPDGGAVKSSGVLSGDPDGGAVKPSGVLSGNPDGGAVKPGDREPPAPRTGQPAAPAPAPASGAGRVHPTRISGLWVGVTVAAVVLLVLLVFIIDNSQTVTVAFFGARGDLPLGVAMLLAAVCGILLVAIPGYARIIQLRRAARRR